MLKYISQSASETEEIARSLAGRLAPPRVICLIGELGAGKTAFTRGFASAFGIEKGVSSPTFTLMHRYDGSVTVNHYDLYRLNSPDELFDIGFEDEIENGFSLIEWADDFMEFMPDDKIIVTISRTDKSENERLIEITGGEFQ